MVAINDSKCLKFSSKTIEILISQGLWNVEAISLVSPEHLRELMSVKAYEYNIIIYSK